MRFADLDPATRRAIRKATAATPARTAPDAPRTARPRPPRPGEPTHRCRACGATFTEWAPAERHVNAEHGGGVVQLTEAGGGRTPEGA